MSANGEQNREDAGNEKQPEESDKSSKSKVIDERLNFYSEKFDPLLALRTGRLQPPVEAAKAFDNLSMFDAFLKRQQSGLQDAETRRKQAPTTSEPAEVQRRFQPHQMPIPFIRKSKRHTVLSRMAAAAEKPGVFSVLENARLKELQVKVTTRHSHGIRGVCIGLVTTFDRFWNLTLKDVTEYWIKRRKLRVPAIGEASKEDFSKYFPKETVLQVEDILSPKYATRYAYEVQWLAKMLQPNEHNRAFVKNSELCVRRMREILIRGDQIVQVVVIDK